MTALPTAGTDSPHRAQHLSRLCARAAAGLRVLLLTLACAGSAWAAGPSAREIEQQYRSGATAQAQQRLDQALAERPGDADLRFLKGVLLSESGRGVEAAGWFERMTQDYPDLPEPHNNLAVLRAASGQLDAARALLETALRLAPQYRTARENLGDVYVRLAAQAYALAAAGANPEPALQRKLALARDLSALR